MFVEHLGSGGAEKVAVNLANGLASRGFAVDMLMWRGGGVNEKDLAPNVGVINFSGGGSKKPGALGAFVAREISSALPARHGVLAS
jgi:hypothetical protein